MNKISYLTYVVFSVFVLSGCARDLSGDTYTREEARAVNTVQYGVVAEARPVIIEGTNSGAGATVGAITGALAGGNAVGGNAEPAIAGILIGTAGAIIGNTIEEKATRRQGVELVITLDGGNSISLVQQADEPRIFYVGQRVKIVGTGSNMRVSPVNVSMAVE